MEDIELRFLERTETLQPSGESEFCRRVQVLQYRRAILVDAGGDQGVGLMWTEWQDVPLVIGL